MTNAVDQPSVVCQDQSRPAHPRRAAGRLSRSEDRLSVARAVRQRDGDGAARARSAITCDEPDIPDRSSQPGVEGGVAAASHRRRASRRRRAISSIDLRKRVPSEAGLGGGSSNAAVTLLALNKLWKLDLDAATLARIGARLGADVPYFLCRRDRAGPRSRRRHLSARRPAPGPRRDFAARASAWRPATPTAGSTRNRGARSRSRRRAPVPAGWPAWSATLRNDLEVAGRPAPPGDWRGFGSRCSTPGRRLPPCPVRDRRSSGCSSGLTPRAELRTTSPGRAGCRCTPARSAAGTIVRRLAAVL